MSGRPCNPGSDLRQLWRTLLGNTPMPQCGVKEKPDAPQANGDEPGEERPSQRGDSTKDRRDR